MFDEEYLLALPESRADAANKICDDFFEVRDRWDKYDDFGQYVGAWSFIKNFAEASEFPFNINVRINSSKKEETADAIDSAFEEFKIIAQAVRHDDLREKFVSKFKSGWQYEFSSGDLQILQTKINEIRTMISENEAIDHDFKTRLLRRLELLQKELHKKMSNLDRFWGLFADAGVALGKFGNEAKPLFDRVREVLEIVWRTQARAEELPSDSPPPQLED